MAACLMALCMASCGGDNKKTTQETTKQEKVKKKAQERISFLFVC